MTSRRTWVLGALIGLVAIGGFLAWPYARTPALIMNPTAISMAFTDAVTQKVYRVGRGEDLYRSQESQTNPTNGRPWPDLCSPSQVRTAKHLPSTCLIARIHWLSECQNAKGCASIQVNPLLLRDSELKGAVTGAIDRPCESLPPNEQPAGTLAYASKFDRKLFRCDARRPWRGSIANANSETGLIIVAFTS